MLLFWDFYSEFNLVKVPVQYSNKFQLYYRLDKQQFDPLLIGVSTVASGSVAQVIWDWLVEDYIPVHKKSMCNMCRKTVIQHRWNFPNCFGAIDNKLATKMPSPLFCLLSSIQATVHGLWRNSDEGILALCPFGKNLQAGCLDLPEENPLPNTGHLGPVQHAFVRDEAFALWKDLRCLFQGHLLTTPQWMFNYSQ